VSDGSLLRSLLIQWTMLETFLNWQYLFLCSLYFKFMFVVITVNCQGDTSDFMLSGLIEIY